MAQTILAFAVNVIGGLFQHLVTVHHGDSAATSSKRKSKVVDPRRRLLEQLRPHGLAKKGLPECAGGSFTSECFRAWMQRQRRLEHQRYCSDEQREQRKRDLNRMHSRRKRVRRHEEFRELQVVAQELTRANVRAKELHSDLRNLLQEANALVELLENGKPPPLYQLQNGTTFIPQDISGPVALLHQDRFESMHSSMLPASNFQQLISGPPINGSHSLQSILNQDLMLPVVPVPPLLSGGGVELLNAAATPVSSPVTLLTGDGGGVPGPPPSLCSNGFQPRLLHPELASCYQECTSAHTIPSQSQLHPALECGSHEFHFPVDSPTLLSAGHRDQHREAVTDLWSDRPPALGITSFRALEPRPSAPPQEPLTLLGVELPVDDIPPRPEKPAADDGSCDGSLFDGILDGWDCAI